MPTIRTYYSPKCPGPGWSDLSWKNARKCSLTSIEEAAAKLRQHLIKSTLHYMSPDDATTMAEAHVFTYHDDEEASVKDEDDDDNTGSVAGSVSAT